MEYTPSGIARFLPPVTEPTPTPCIGVCSTGIGDLVCRGCKRFAHEVTDWNCYDALPKQAVERRLQSFLCLVTEDKLRVTDAGRLHAKLAASGLPCLLHRQGASLVFELLRAGAESIGSPGDFGFEVLPAYRDLPLTELRQLIDREFYELSLVYYERRVRPMIAGQGGTPQVSG